MEHDILYLLLLASPEMHSSITVSPMRYNNQNRIWTIGSFFLNGLTNAEYPEDCTGRQRDLELQHMTQPSRRAWDIPMFFSLLLRANCTGMIQWVGWSSSGVGSLLVVCTLGLWGMELDGGSLVKRWKMLSKSREQSTSQGRWDDSLWVEVKNLCVDHHQPFTSTWGKQK